MKCDDYSWDGLAFEEFIRPIKNTYDHSMGGGSHALKRLFDLAASLFGLALLLPLLPFIILLIRLETPGPIFFKQTRVGQGGRLFPCYKFRSMAVDAESRKDELNHLNEATGAAFKIKDDPRITGVGRFLRRSSLDEFPQLINVFRGEMSIVGPRPQIPSEVADYTQAQACRLLVKPGLTCLWQVSGRSHLEFEEWMQLDLEYVLSQSLKTDTLILLRTLPAVIERKGAY
jgi:lipopolysaccharide/colanic/teichoic acid biosynthesis glycosyltransferase